MSPGPRRDEVVPPGRADRAAPSAGCGIRLVCVEATLAAVAFAALCIIRWAPLFYWALACLGLFVGARRWLGRFGGLAAVGLYCSSGAALAFAWRDYMPTFTDASLIAAGSGTLLWAVLATEAS